MHFHFLSVAVVSSLQLLSLAAKKEKFKEGELQKEKFQRKMSRQKKEVLIITERKSANHVLENHLC